jgi:GTP-binding protein
VENNVSIQLEKAQGDAYEVMGRGELQLAILVENMRREGEREECVRDIDKR